MFAGIKQGGAHKNELNGYDPGATTPASHSASSSSSSSTLSPAPGVSLYERAQKSAAKKEAEARAFREKQYTFQPKLATPKRRAASHGAQEIIVSSGASTDGSGGASRIGSTGRR